MQLGGLRKIEWSVFEHMFLGNLRLRRYKCKSGDILNITLIYARLTKNILG